MNIDYFGQAEKIIKYLYPNENPIWAKDGSEIFLNEEDLKLIKKMSIVGSSSKYKCKYTFKNISSIQWYIRAITR